MKQIDLPVKLRTKNSKNGNRRARRGGEVPAIIYGGEQAPQPALVDSVSFVKMLGTIHRSTIFNLKVDGNEVIQQAIIRDMQRHPVNDKPIHIDFYRIQVDKPIVVDIPVHGVGGVPAGVKLGGLLEHITRRLEIRCLPLEVPEFLEIDVSGIMIGHSLHVSDLKAPEGVEVLTPGHEVLFIVAAPKAEEEAKPAEEVAAAAQPELVGEKEKKEKEEAEKAEEGKKKGK